MLTPARTESFRPSAGLIASLATTTWLDTAPTGATLCCLLLVPQPPRSFYETPAVIAQRMRAVAEALRLGPATAPPPDIGPRLRLITPTEVALRFDATPYRKRIPTGRPWSLLLGQGTPVALVLGLDPLSRSATPAQIDTYLDRATLRQRLLFAHTRTE
ncbi:MULTISPECIES: hypothetical protein [Streptomyces]|uniref:Uncharacterized protein n=1 Tax=Streptomyces dengpaensis TaxID=2049881 RepID=A0ABM6SPK1_9ACTN|nr:MULTISPECIES: hypothetical protein [Streptomyces]AVH56566.1 hypothetical protein C4B68_13170 [Streptomyces dengpaensis]PIB10408.1 hypothetical protein B1C81_07945 [Streptomyces sp. HG99]